MNAIVERLLQTSIPILLIKKSTWGADLTNAAIAYLDSLLQEIKKTMKEGILN